MDLTHHNFAYYLPWLLKDLTQSDFVSVDFELSGIALPSSQTPKVQTLQERYLDTKVAAEKYQILQVGLTICNEDAKSGTYQLRPFNINLSPIVDRSLDINREWTFSSSAVEFLSGSRFNFDALCKQGVRYLTRNEEQQARDKQRHHYLNIPPALIRYQEAQRCEIPSKLLNQRQRYLVHKVIRLEYPDLKSRNRHGFVQITKTTAEKNRLVLERKWEEIEQKIQKGIGFRWIAEALVGGDLSSLESATFAPLMAQTENPSFTLEELSSGLKKHLKEKRVVFVGHNCFMDLVYFYRHFIGKLPDTVEEFKVQVHRVFPLVIDTKYLVTANDDPSVATSSLGDACREVARAAIPKISIDTVYSKYAWSECLHEAGYDSMLAAFLFIKLSAQLYKEGRMYQGTKGTLQQLNIEFVNNPPFNVQELFNSISNGRSQQASSTSSDHVDRADKHDEGMDSDAYFPKGTFQSLAEPGNDAIAYMVHQGLLVPRLDSEFWGVYGNKLRVYGTHEGVMDVGEAGKTS